MGAAVRAALDLLHEVIEQRAPRFCQQLPDDTLLWADNRRTLHGRADYTDAARHLIRIRPVQVADAELVDKRILGVGDGPASFNAEMRERGRRVVSCDPIYVFTAEQIRSRVEATHDRMVEFARQHHDNILWRHLR